ncbi:NlpC/P60 family protein [Actinomadura luteofluorescens]|uniref:NlpC/P60 family protein n=1 Tax=Actinomadura luteofluorescens TaxID=46163 RepID=UPI003D8A3574
MLQYAFGKAGVRLPRVADDPARAGCRNTFDKAGPGDLFTWAHDPTAPGYISHIALYLGETARCSPRRGAAPRTHPAGLLQKLPWSDLNQSASRRAAGRLRAARNFARRSW